MPRQRVPEPVPDDRAVAAAALPQSPEVQNMLALQRTAGNRAATQYATLARYRARTVSPEQAGPLLTSAVLAGAWHDAIDALNALEAAERDRRLAELTITDLVKLRQAVLLRAHGVVPPVLEPVERAIDGARAQDKLHHEYVAAVDAGDWLAAATALKKMPAPEYEKRIALLGYEALLKLAVGIRDAQGGDALATAAVKRLKPLAACTAALKGEDFATAAKLLDTFDEIAFRDRVLTLTPEQREDLDEAGKLALGEGWQRSSQRLASFSEVIPLATGSRTEDLAGGVTVGTDAKYLLGGRTQPSGFSLSYGGADAVNANWLQFIWREIIVSKPGHSDEPLDQEVKTSGGKYRLTTNRSAPVYNTDSGSKKPPFYPSSAATGEGATMYDHPGSLDLVIHELFDQGARRVVSRAHFDSFLVVGSAIRYHVQLDVEWTFARPGDPPRVYSVPSAKAATGLPGPIRACFEQQFPQHKHIGAPPPAESKGDPSF